MSDLINEARSIPRPKLVIKIAKVLSLDVPATALARADEVIE